MVAEQAQENKDIEKIAYPFGGAHLKVTETSSSLMGKLSKWSKPLSLVAIIIAMMVVFYPAGQYLRSKSVTSFRTQYASTETKIEALSELEARTMSRLAKDRQKLADTKADKSLDFRARRAITKDIELLIDENQKMLELLREEVVDNSDYKLLVERSKNSESQKDEKKAQETALGIDEFAKKAKLIESIHTQKVKIRRNEIKLADAGGYKAKQTVSV